jgi:hypothetical protein
MGLGNCLLLSTVAVISESVNVEIKVLELRARDASHGRHESTSRCG